MLLSERLRTALLLVGLACLVPGVGAAETPDLPEETFTGTHQAGSGNATLRLGYYDNDDSDDGNPFLDEDLQVIEPVFIVDYNVTDRLGMYLLGSGDLVSSASIDRLSEIPNTQQSGASGDYYFGGDLGLRYDVSSESKVGGFVHASTEYDYNSLGAGANFSRDFAQKNTTLSLALTGYRDTVDLIRFNGDEQGEDVRWTGTAKVGWYQVIDAKTHGELSATGTVQSGFLETAFNAFVVEDPTQTIAPNPRLENLARGVEVTEELPGQRWRGSVQGRIRRQLWPGTALELGGRYYADDWGLSALTGEPVIHQRLFTDALTLRLGYRYTHQEAARYYEERFFGAGAATSPPAGSQPAVLRYSTRAPRYRTQDSDLGDFDAHGVSAHLFWSLTPTLKVDFGGELVNRDDGIDPLFGSVGISKDF